MARLGRSSPAYGASHQCTRDAGGVRTTKSQPSRNAPRRAGRGSRGEPTEPWETTVQGTLCKGAAHSSLAISPALVSVRVLSCAPDYRRRPPAYYACNVFVYCPLEKCYAPAALPPGSMMGQCWLKHQPDPMHPQVACYDFHARGAVSRCRSFAACPRIPRILKSWCHALDR